MTYTISAEIRELLGRQAKQVLTSGKIPAVVYGHGIEPRAVQVARSDFRKVLKEAGSSSLIDLDLGGDNAVKVLIQDVQVNPVTMEPRHIDFRQIRMDEEIEVEVPLRFIGESRAVKEEGGTLMTQMDSVHVECLPGSLPKEFVVDLSKLASFDDTIMIKSLEIPAGVKILDELEAIIANASRPMTEEELKKMDEAEATMDVSGIKTEAEEKKAAEEAEKAEEAEVEKK
ncbi:MAG: 50S ribosomal protein L25 [Patescibacteria group bacterium]